MKTAYTALATAALALLVMTNFASASMTAPPVQPATQTEQPLGLLLDENGMPFLGGIQLADGTILT